jgi:ribosomal-protein-alanine N-acetyltransferase
MGDEALVRIRAMSVGDVGCVLEIAGSLPHAPQWPESAYLAAMDSQGTRRRIALVAENGEGGVVGFLVASVLAPEAELETVAVAIDAQRVGIGGRLMEALAVELRGSQVSELNLEVRASNLAAVGLYRARGFAECGRRKRYYADPEEDAVLMRMALSEAG